MTRKTITVTTLVTLLISGFFLNGCVTPFSSKAKPNPELAAEYMKKGKALEEKGALIEAHEQYKLALTVDPENIEAGQNKARLAHQLSKLADERYKLGMKYHRQGKYGLARKEFLTALKYQPDHPKASKMLVSRQPQKAPSYRMHTIQPGESLSIIAKKYYGDYQKYDVIARFNNLDDATRIKPGQTIMIPDLQTAETPGMAAIPEKKTTGYVWHTIQPGQSISKLAQIYYGDYQRFHVIAKFNDMDDATRIKAGDRVKVPKVAGLPFYDPAKTRQKETAAPPPTETAAVTDPTEPAPQPEEPLVEEQEPLVEEQESRDTNGNTQIVAYRDTGITFYNEARYSDAIFELNKAIEASPDDALTKSYLSKAYFESGKEHFYHKDYDAAREAFESSRQYDPKCAECEAYIGKAKAAPALIFRDNGIDYLNRNEFSSAILEFEKYIQMRPGDPEGRKLLSKSFFQKALIDYNRGDFMAAKQGFESALDYDRQCDKCTDYVRQSLNSFKSSHYNKGVGYYGREQLAEAVAEWEKVYALDPNYKDVEPKLKKARNLLKKLERIKKSRQQ